MASFVRDKVMHGGLSDLPIAFERTTYRAGDVTILDGISLSISSGAPTLLIGPNGSGKSTLIKLGMGLIEASEGRVSWGGRSNAASPRRAMVFQRPVMLRRTAAENIAYALASRGVPRADQGPRINALLEQVGLGHRRAVKLGLHHGDQHGRIAVPVRRGAGAAPQTGPAYTHSAPSHQRLCCGAATVATRALACYATFI